MYGVYGKVLIINLSHEKFEIIRPDESVYLACPGGKGLATWLLLNFNPAGVDPLSPENGLIFATGPLTGSDAWGSSRYGVFTKSPQTGYYSESYAGGKTPEAVAATGYDAILISGKRTDPTVLEITPEGAVFHPADDIWGMDTYDAEDAIKKRYGRTRDNGFKSGAVVIGPAGENQVRFSVIENDYWRSAGRTGAGAVMGAKKLKGICFKGNQKRALYNPEGLRRFSRDMRSHSLHTPQVEGYRAFGTSKNVKILNRAGAFPSRYWSSGTSGHWEKIDHNALHTRCDVTPHACAKCFMACGRKATVKNGRHKGLVIEGPEYETIFAFGGLCQVDSIEEIVFLNDICDRLGMDTISAGNLCGFAIEASRRQKIDFKIDYNDADGIALLLNMIAKRKGVGDVLAKGILHAAGVWEMEDVAVHVKGLEPPGYDPRVLKGCGLAYAVSNRGACHLRATFHGPELSGKFPSGSNKGKAELLVDYEDRLLLMDCLILCHFFRDIYSWDKICLVYNMVTGRDPGRFDLRQMAAGIVTDTRIFNIREGLKREEDTLPDRILKNQLKSGGRITAHELEKMVLAYYTARGWDENGIPVSKI